MAHPPVTQIGAKVRTAGHWEKLLACARTSPPGATAAPSPPWPGPSSSSLRLLHRLENQPVGEERARGCSAPLRGGFARGRSHRAPERPGARLGHPGSQAPAQRPCEDATPFCGRPSPTTVTNLGIGGRPGLWRVLFVFGPVMEPPGGVPGTCSPGARFWASFDLAVTRSAPDGLDASWRDPNLTDDVAPGAYSHEVSTLIRSPLFFLVFLCPLVIWPGGDAHRTPSSTPMPIPDPKGRRSPGRPDAAYWLQGLGELHCVRGGCGGPRSGPDGGDPPLRPEQLRCRCGSGGVGRQGVEWGSGGPPVAGRGDLGFREGR